MVLRLDCFIPPWHLTQVSLHRPERKQRCRFVRIFTRLFVRSLILYKFQGLVGAVFEGVGVSLGSLLAGNLFERIGGSRTFRLFGIAALLLAVAHVLIQYFMDRFGTEGKQVDKVGFGEARLNAARDTDNCGFEVDRAIIKTDSILSESTVQEEIDMQGLPCRQQAEKLTSNANGSLGNVADQSVVFHDVDLAKN